MGIGLVGRKAGMTRIFTDAGETVPVTVIEVLPNRVTQVKAQDKNGYRAVQVTYGTRRPQLYSKAVNGHYAKAGVAPGRALVEFRLTDADKTELAAGAEIKADLFKEGDPVDVTGTTIGKGFAGTIKRHNFAGGMASHGNSLSHRAPGSIGQRQTPGPRVQGPAHVRPHGRRAPHDREPQGGAGRPRAEPAPDPRCRARRRGWPGDRARLPEGRAPRQAQDHHAHQGRRGPRRIRPRLERSKPS